MKTKFRYYRSLALTSLLTFGAASLLTSSAAELHKRGTDILHLSLTRSITNDAVASGANGNVRLKFQQQGHSTVQSLDLNVSSLDTAIPYYVLLASTVDDPFLKPVAVFTSDANGIAKMRYTSVVTGNGKVHKPARGKTALPAELDPLSHVRQLVVADGVITQAVMTANLENPEHLSYLVKRDISTDTIPASLRIQANDQRGQFGLRAGRLTASTDYKLLLNGGSTLGGSEQVVTTDAKGNLDIRFAIENPLDAFALKTVEILDSGDVSVLKVSLP